MAAPQRSLDFPRSQHSYSSPANRMPSRGLTNSRTFQPSARLRLRLTGLPPHASTLDVFENLCQYGSIVRIHLFETREGFKSTRAEVDFQPRPSQEFWRRPLLFETRSHQSAEVHFQTANAPPQAFEKESPLRQGIKYKDRTELSGRALDFGVLVEPAKMMVMGRAGSMQHRPKLVLNLHRKEIEIHFPWQQISSNRSAVRTFRFNIALDAEVRVWRLADHSFVLHVAKPPWYSKQLAEAIANTHSHDARTWTIEDTWARQTDLWTYKQSIPEINTAPITLAKYLNDINIFRWSTFRFDPVNERANMIEASTFVHALRDWNVKVQDGESFKIFDAEPEMDKKVWKLINDTHHDVALSAAADLSQIQLPFTVRYQLEVCLSHGWLSEYSITPEFLHNLFQLPEISAKQALLYVAIDQKRLFDPMIIFNDIHYSKPVRAKRLPSNCIEICSATVTTTGILFNTPTVEITNRVIRKHKAHAHRFLRVRFEDDDYKGQTRLFPSTNNKMVMIFMRVKRALTNGIKMGNVLYEFLAWGNSQLREHSAYFFAASDELTADSIRAEMGDFKETVVAKKAARMGQCFSTTRPVRLALKMIHEPDTIPDIVRNGYTFSDGVGKISPAAAELVASQLQIKGPTPCLFQFRLGGCKGVLAVSKEVPGVDVRIRKSQLKFKSLSNELEINRYAQFWQACLNRQIILCLSSLGVPTEVFIRRQRDTIATLNRAMHDDGAAVNALRSNIDPNMMTLELSRMVESGFRESQEPFVVSLLELWRAWSLKYLKEKAKIPIQEGAFVLGTVDETASLQGHTSACPSGDVDAIMADTAALEKLPEIFIQITDHTTGERRVIEGICILARNPSLHRGDIRVVRARDVPALHHMCDVVVMPQLGDRDLPSMCSGGDLDGDDYIVIWAKDLIPRIWNAEPFHYEPPVPKMAVGEIKTSDLIDFFHDYMQNDALGKIATAHMAAADYFDDGLENHICLDLAQLHSMAVDYPKTGVPAKMERRLERPEKPHFMDTRSKTYRSHKVLGQLYNEIHDFYNNFQKSTFIKHDLEFDARILSAYEPDAAILVKVESVKRAYDISLRRILSQHSIQTEFELWSTFVLDHSKKSRDYKFHEEVGDLSRVLKEEYYEELCDIAGGRDFDHLAPVAVAAYKLTQQQLQAAKIQASSQLEGEISEDTTFISFPWILQDTLIKIASQTASRDTQTTKEAISETAGGHVTDELYDVANFQLTRDKLSLYLPDPLTIDAIDSANNATGKPDTETSFKAVEEQYTNTLNSPPFKDSETVPNPNLKVISPVDDITIELLDQNGSDHASKISCKLDSHHPVEESHVKCAADQLRCSSSESGDARSKQSMQQTPPSSDASDRDHILMAATFPSPKIQQNSSVDHESRQKATCFYWKMGKTCRYSASDCIYAHHDTGIDMPEKKLVTCYYWLNGGGCINDDVSCKFAHHDTGYYALQPSTSVLSKERCISKTKRVVAESSGSDNDEHLVRTKPTPRTPSANTHQLSGEVSTEQDRSNYAQKDMSHGALYSRNSLSAAVKGEHSAVYVNDALAVHGVSREHASSSKYRRMSTEGKSFVPKVSVRSAAYHTRALPQRKPTTQLIDVADVRKFNENPAHISKSPTGQFHGASNKVRSSWADDLQGLIFDDKATAPAKPDVVKETEHNMTSTLQPTALIDLLDEPHAQVPRDESRTDLLPYTSPSSSKKSPAADLGNATLEVSNKEPERITFGDPLASHNDGDEPEIEELFD